MVVVVRMIGGLGGQMFQYALGRSLSIRNNDSLELDLTDFAGTGRQFELGSYNIKATIATTERRNAMRINRFFALFVQSKHIREKHPFDYDPDISGITGNMYLEGYWADQRYFEGIEKTLRNDFTPANELDPVCKLYLAAIKNKKNSVAVHFRRTDYPNEIGVEYYCNAVAEIRDLYPDSSFVVFSDGVISPGHFGIPQARCINLSGSGHKPFEDMYLMSQCTHHIIANSTYSWWGAWLGSAEDQTVIAPTTWFLDRDTPETLCPKEWIRLPNSISKRHQEPI